MSNPQILVVDDAPNSLQMLTDLLQVRGYHVTHAINAQQAFARVGERIPDLILLDVGLPDMDGYEICHLLKEDPAFENVPILFLSAFDEVADKVQGFRVGGVDYITKPFQTDEVIARLQTHLELALSRRVVETMRAREIAYLEQLNTLKDDILKMVTHDLKNPLGIISGVIHMLRDDLRNHMDTIPASTERQLHMMERAADKMKRLIDDMLQMARAEGRLDRTSMRETNLESYVRVVVHEFEVAARQRNVHLSFVPPGVLVSAFIAADRLNHAIENLVSNAIKYTPEGGSVEVRLEVYENQAYIHVIDTGLGIPSEDIPRLFERFYRVQREDDPRRSGTGLGLAIAKGIVEQHSGQLHVSSELGQGSTFTIVLPIIQRAL